jgi:hypothetical protein
MYASVSPAGGNYTAAFSGKPPYGPFQFSLNCRQVNLPLEAIIISAVILHNQNDLVKTVKELH